MNRNILISGFVVLVLIAGAFAISSFKQTKGDGGQPKADKVRQFAGETQSPGITPDEPQLGAIPGDQVFSETFSINGNKFYSYRVAMTSATNTPCIIKLPGATTTIVSANASARTYGSTTIPTFSFYAAYLGQTGTSSAQAFAGRQSFDAFVSATSSIGTSTPGSTTTPKYIILDVKGATAPTLAGWCNILLNEVHP